LFSQKKLDVAGFTGQTGSMKAEENASGEAEYASNNKYGMMSRDDNLFGKGDRASVAASAPKPMVSLVHYLIESVLQTPADSAVTKWIQFFSLAITQRINTVISYSAKINKFSSFDSVITWKLHPVTDSGRSDMGANVQYVVRF